MKKTVLTLACFLLLTATLPAQQDAKDNAYTEHGCEDKFSIRTNLLYWAVATPNLGIEYKPAENFGILVNSAYSHWIWSDDDNHHRTWLVQPEVRYYIGANKNWFIGVEGHAGEFNFKFKDTGYQGDAIRAMLSGRCYRWRIDRRLQTSPK
ncbi:hypothetical protein FACS189438_1970 [Bacteroidia bacterium]|nr:hypothetical protein FACS189438_1970 [Bacteroidia bacterium]